MTLDEFNNLKVGDVLKVRLDTCIHYLEEIVGISMISEDRIVNTQEILCIDTRDNEYTLQDAHDEYISAVIDSLEIYDNSYGSIETIKTKILLGVFP